MKAHGISFDVAELSDPGRDPTKQVNEDCSGSSDTPAGFALVLCDGMGGHENGRLASETAVQTILASLSAATPGAEPTAALQRAVEAAGSAVYELGGDAPMGMRPGSTCVAALIHESGAEIAHVGDSRVYLVRAGALEQLTRDHSMVQHMVDAGVLTPADAQHHPEANRITRALGMRPQVEPELRPNPVQLSAGDALLLCSDGLTDMLDDAEILQLCAANLPSGPAVVCQRLVERANERGGHDNISVQLAVIRDMPSQPRLDPTWVDMPAQTAGSSMASGAAVPLGGNAAPRPHGAGAVAPTLVDELQEPVRNTEPTVAYRFPDSAAAGGGPERVRRNRARVMLVVVLLVAAAVALVLWVRFHRSATEEPIPEPSSTPGTSPAPPAPSRTLLAPDVPDAGPDAAMDGADAGWRRHHHHRR